MVAQAKVPSFTPKEERPTERFGLFLLWMGLELRRKFAQQISRRGNSGHPLFIGYGRTGESPILHTKRMKILLSVAHSLTIHQ